MDAERLRGLGGARPGAPLPRRPPAALVALHRPTDEPADRDAVTYWSDWVPDPVGAANGRQATRVAASMYLRFDGLRELFLETCEALEHAVAGLPGEQRVRTQGHVLTVDDLLSTLAVEETVHHLDAVVGLPGRPAPPASGLAEVRRVLDGLLGRPLPEAWSDTRCALVGTGRLPLTPEERRALGSHADRLPLFS